MTITRIYAWSGVAMTTTSASSSKRILRIITITIAIMVIYYLLTRHASHTFGVLPYLLILACPLMHLFGHHHHGKHEHRDTGDDA